MRQVKGKGKTAPSNLSPAEAHIAAAAKRAGGQQEAISIWDRQTEPSYIHGSFYLTSPLTLKSMKLLRMLRGRSSRLGAFVDTFTRGSSGHWIIGSYQYSDMIGKIGAKSAKCLDISKRDLPPGSSG